MITGTVITIKPSLFFDPMRSKVEDLRLYLSAVVVRGFLGVILLSHAGHTKLPLTMEALGWIALSVAAGLTVVGRANFIRMMHWALHLGPAYERAGGLLAMILGGLMAYAAS